MSFSQPTYQIQTKTSATEGVWRTKLTTKKHSKAERRLQALVAEGKRGVIRVIVMETGELLCEYTDGQIGKVRNDNRENSAKNN